MIAHRTLSDGGQRPADVAGWAAEFVGAARTSLDLALYDLNLAGESEALVRGALEGAAARVGAAGGGGGSGGASARRRGRCAGAPLVLSRLRRCALPPHGEGDRERASASADLLAGDHGRAGARDARAGGLGRQDRPGRVRGR